MITNAAGVIPSFAPQLTNTSSAAAATMAASCCSTCGAHRTLLSEINFGWRMLGPPMRCSFRCVAFKPQHSRRNRDDSPSRAQTTSEPTRAMAPGVPMTTWHPLQLTFDFGSRRDVAGTAAIERSTKACGPKAQFIPFPLERRRPLIVKMAAEMVAALTEGDAERIFQGRLARLGRCLRRKRVPERVIDLELRALEAAVRTELSRIALGAPARTVETMEGKTGGR
jgi:hypothetical protein